MTHCLGQGAAHALDRIGSQHPRQSFSGPAINFRHIRNGQAFTNTPRDFTPGALVLAVK
jgi:hypothetical protein